MIPLVTAAFAQEEACPGTLAVAEVDQVLAATTTALEDLDGDRAAHLVEEVSSLLRCLGGVLTPDQLGRFAATSSVVAFYEQDFEEARRWAELAVTTTGSANAGSVSVPERWWADYGALVPTVGEAAGVVSPPPGGVVVVDGRALLAARAAVATPHLLQLVDRKGRVLSTRWFDGVAFPEDVVAGSSPPSVPRWWTEPPTVTVIEPGTVVAAPVAAPEVVFDGVVSTQGCPFTPDPQDVRARGRRVTIEGQSWVFRKDEDVTEFRDVLRTCGEFRAARRFAKWQVSSAFSGAKEFREAFVEALRTPEPRRNKRK